MALATMSTAWCSYQASAWTRKSGRLMAESNSLERRAGVLTLRGMQLASMHTAMFMQMLAAQEAGNEKLAKFYRDRFPPELRKAYDAWMTQKPSENPDASAHPFVPELYELPGTKEADATMSKAEARVQDASTAGSVSGQYLANTVLFATVLFFAGTAGKFERGGVRTAESLFAIAIFAFAVVRTAMLPR
jgi:hypothetical protein